MERATADEIVARLAAHCAGGPLDEAAVSGLRAAWPGLIFTFCSDDDMGTARPAIEAAGFNVYLIDASSHCLALTDDFERAAGLVLAAVTAEE